MKPQPAPQMPAFPPAVLTTAALRTCPRQRHGGNLVSLTALALAFATSLPAARPEDRQIRPNMQVHYLEEPRAVGTLGGILSEGTLHGRVRAHFFSWDWENEKTSGGSQTRDNQALGLGGSMVFRSARFHGFSGTAGFYASRPVHSDNTAHAAPLTNFGRAGKDTYRTRLDGTEASLNVLGEAFFAYDTKNLTLRAGRQIIDSLLLASNDTKMIPNTFEAARVELRSLPKTKIGAAVVRRQKLRDHATFHSVIAYTKSLGNDDSGAHRGLTPQNLAAAGQDPEPLLLLLTAENRSIPNLRLAADYVGLGGLLSTFVADANYEVKTAGKWTITPGLRVLRQWDRGAGAIGGASLAGTFARDRVFTTGPADLLRLASYRAPRSLDGSLWAARVTVARGRLQMVVGTSRIADRADIVAPWRGFPTGGFTRSMAQLDWLAATTNRMARVEYDFGKTRWTSQLALAAGYGQMNFDARKIAAGSVVPTDRGIFNVDTVFGFRALPRTAFKIRLGFLDADARPGSPIDQESYRETRLEVNRLF